MQFILVGLCAGVLGGLFGLGGGIVIVPALILIARMTPQMATGTSLGALLLPVGFLGAIQYYRSGSLNVRVGLLIALGLFVGIYFGAQLALRLPARELQRAFAVFLVLVAVRLWFKA
ncbi:MAG TPA: sulfite exporter TauE/SafE family protein [Candidatus Bathyarchaeia archaeon]|nr:sulfite exporter TauE/SafE family protein [Candidatus Bathyarchaeia archaeon]